MKPAPFAYHAPASAEEAVSLLSSLGDGAKVIAGGQSLTPMLALRLAVFDHLVDVRRISSLQGITRSDGSVRIGAGTTQAVIGRSDVVAADVPLLARATSLIGHFQIRNRGTIGGSLAHADAAAEYPAVALALDAVLHALSPRGPRAIPAAKFFTGIWTTALEPDELLTSVEFPAWSESPKGGGSGRSGFAVEEFAVRRGDFALAGAAVAVSLSESGSGSGSGSGGTVTRCGIGLFGLGPTALRAPEAEALVNGASVAGISADEVGRAAMAGLDAVPSDTHGSAAYRTRVGAAMVAKAWRRAVAEAEGSGGGA
jgi:carbon-monoxide dehydrogenase medium subunit